MYFYIVPSISIGLFWVLFAPQEYRLKMALFAIVVICLGVFITPKIQANPPIAYTTLYDSLHSVTLMLVISGLLLIWKNIKWKDKEGQKKGDAAH